MCYEFNVFLKYRFKHSLELTSKILSQCSEDTAQLTRLIKLLTQIRTDLNRRKMCMLQGNLNEVLMNDPKINIKYNSFIYLKDVA